MVMLAFLYAGEVVEHSSFTTLMCLSLRVVEIDSFWHDSVFLILTFLKNNNKISSLIAVLHGDRNCKADWIIN